MWIVKFNKLIIKIFLYEFSYTLYHPVVMAFVKESLEVDSHEMGTLVGVGDDAVHNFFSSKDASGDAVLEV